MFEFVPLVAKLFIALLVVVAAFSLLLLLISVLGSVISAIFANNREPIPLSRLNLKPPSEPGWLNGFIVLALLCALSWGGGTYQDTGNILGALAMGALPLAFYVSYRLQAKKKFRQTHGASYPDRP